MISNFNGRVAVCITGSPRSTPSTKIPLNTSEWPDARSIFLEYLNTTMQKEFMNYVKTETPFVTDTIHKFAYPSFGRFDVFMYLAVKTGEEVSTKIWKPYVPRLSRNIFFLNTGPDILPTYEDLNTTKELYEYAEKLFLPRGAFKHALAAQTWDEMKCADMIIKHEMTYNFKYDVIVRMRADSVFFAPIPKVTTVSQAGCDIFIRPFKNGCCGNQDIFNFGPRDIMIQYLQRLNEFTSIVSRFVKNEYDGEFYTSQWFASICGKDWNEGISPIFMHPWRFNNMHLF